MIYTSVYFTMIYKDSQKLEKTRKYRKPMPHNQGVAGSCPAGTTKRPTSSDAGRSCYLVKMLCQSALVLNPILFLGGSCWAGSLTDSAAIA